MSTPSLDPNHPTRERVHFPGVPGTFMPGDGPAAMVEQTEPASAELPPPAAPAPPRVGLAIGATFGTPTVGNVEPEAAPAPAPKPRRRKDAADTTKDGEA